MCGGHRATRRPHCIISVLTLMTYLHCSYTSGQILLPGVLKPKLHTLIGGFFTYWLLEKFEKRQNKKKLIPSILEVKTLGITQPNLHSSLVAGFFTYWYSRYFKTISKLGEYTCPLQVELGQPLFPYFHISPLYILLNLKLLLTFGFKFGSFLHRSS
jgi:hypothetical protein